MWVLIGLLVLLVLLAVVVFVVQPCNDEIAICGMLVSAMFLVIGCATIPIYRADARNHLIQRDALQQSYNELRKRPLEMATVGKEIAAWNAWLASAKYWNSTQWRWWWPDDVRNTKPIQ